MRIYTMALEASLADQRLRETYAATPHNDFNATDRAQSNATFQSIASTLRVTQ